MEKIDKGIVLTIEGNKDRNENFTMARVQSVSSEAPTLPIVIPWYLRGEMGQLKKGTEVIYAVFADASGIILGRADGNWSGTFEEKNLTLDLKGQTCVVNGHIPN